MVAENVRTVRFIGPQDAEDLYRCQENGMVYVRQPCDDDHVRWLTSSKWYGGYEASSPLKVGITMRVVDKTDHVLFEEQIIRVDGYCDTVAVKVGGFSDEEIDKITQSVCKSVQLRSYNEWKAWMMRAASEYQYTGYYDNWLYAEVSYENHRTLFQFEYLGQTAYATITKETHKISGKSWECVEIRDQSKLECLDICGYIFEED